MLEQLRAWLNGKREYYAGVALLAEAGGAAPLLAVLKKGPTPFSTAKLQGELLAICNQLKATQNDRSKASQEDETRANKERILRTAKPDGKEEVPERKGGNDSQLFQACRHEALAPYKTAMNDRAILFSQANALSKEEVNLPHHVASRASLALAIVRNYNMAAQLFERADHVKLHGRLPDDVTEESQPAYDALPDDLVYPTLSNLRKAKSKLKKKEQTTERIALLQQHESNILKLEGRWRLLKGK